MNITINKLLLDLSKESNIEINTIEIECPEVFTTKEEKIENKTLN